MSDRRFADCGRGEPDGRDAEFWEEVEPRRTGWAGPGARSAKPLAGEIGADNCSAGERAWGCQGRRADDRWTRR